MQRSPRHRFVLNASSMAIGGLAAQACMVVVEAIIARTLGQGDYGVFSTTYAIGIVGLFLIEMGMGWKLIQDGSRDDRSMPALLGTTLVLKILLALAVYPLMLFGLMAIGLESEAVGFFAVLFFYVLLMSLQNSLAAVYSARQHMHVNALFQGSTPFLILILVSLAATGSLTLRSVGVAFVAGSLIVTGIWAWRTFTIVRPVVQLGSTWQILRGSYLYGATGLLLHVSQRLELFLLSIMRPMAEVGLFAAADKLIDLGIKVAIMGNRVVAPVLFKESREQPDQFQRSCRRVVRSAAVLGVGGALALSLTATWVVPAIFGKAFGGAGAILSILALSLALRFMGLAAQLVVTVSDRHMRRTVAQASGVVVAGAANFVLIPGLGGFGAACARLVGDVVQITLLLTTSGLPVGRARALTWMLVPALLGFICFVVTTLVELGAYSRLVAGMGLYAVLLFSTGTVRISDIREAAGS